MVPKIKLKILRPITNLPKQGIRFCLYLGDRSHIGPKEFEQINWLPVNIRFEQCVTSHVFKQQNNITPTYMNELFKSTAPPRVSTRSSTNKLVEPPCHRLIYFTHRPKTLEQAPLSNKIRKFHQHF